MGTTQTAPPRAATGGRPRSAAVVTLTSRSRAGGGGGDKSRSRRVPQTDALLPPSSLGAALPVAEPRVSGYPLLLRVF